MRKVLHKTDHECACGGNKYIMFVQFTPNQLHVKSCHPAMPRYSVRVGARCAECLKFYKWIKQTPELMESLKNAVLSK